MIINYIAMVSPQQLSASLQILEPLCVKRCAVGIAASGISWGKNEGIHVGKTIIHHPPVIIIARKMPIDKTIAMENGPAIVDLTIKDCDFSTVMLVYWRLIIRMVHLSMLTPTTKKNMNGGQNLVALFMLVWA